MLTLSKDKIKYLLHNLGISYANSFLGFLIFLFLARLLGASDYALVAIGLAVGGFIIPLVDLGSARTFVRDAVTMDDPADIERMVLSSFNMRLIVAASLFFPLIVFSYFYTNNLEETISVACISLWVGLLGLYPTSWFDFLHDTARQNFCAMAERIATLILVVGLTFITVSIHMGIIIGLALLFIRSVSISFQIWLWWKKYSSGCFSLRWISPGKKLLGINYRFTLALVFNALFIYGNQLILGKNSDGIELSAYSLAFQLISLIFLFQALVLRLFNREISEICKSQHNVIHYVAFHGALLAGISAIFAFVVFIVSRYIPAFLVDPRFELIPQFVPLLSVWIVIVGGGQVITQYLMEMKQESLYLITSIAGGMLALSLGVVFVPNYGATAIIMILIVVHTATISTGLMRLLYMSMYDGGLKT